MPTIRPSADIRNDYNGVSEYCHTYQEPVFISKNGRGDLAVMAIEAYEKLAGKSELYDLLRQGVEADEQGDTHDFKSALNSLRTGLS